MKCNVVCLTLLLMLLISGPTKAQMNNPYVDDKRIHFGFSLGFNLMSFSVTDSEEEINGEIYHARVSNLVPGFQVGFITDVRLSQHVNFRFTPGLEFASRTISYKTESGNPVKSPNYSNKIDILAIPITIPVYIKFSADREKNYRPYVIAGGGINYNVSRDREKPVLLNGLDYFVSVGLGVDLYLRWFKLCPEIKYQIGFANLLAPVDDRPEVAVQDMFYTQALKRLTSHMITFTFNFE